ncbi:MAG TPA: DUF2934 domain-containing protein [Gaiellaceae bacterium]|jgi:hypothetical protein
MPSKATEAAATKKPAAKAEAAATTKPAARRTVTRRTKKAEGTDPIVLTWEHVATRAYYIHLEEGGDPLQNWLRAESELVAV